MDGIDSQFVIKSVLLTIALLIAAYTQYWQIAILFGALAAYFGSLKKRKTAKSQNQSQSGGYFDDGD